MTRLQSMFIQLSKCKTLKELEKAMSKPYVNELLAEVAFDKYGKVHTCGYFETCKECDLKCSESQPFEATIDYLNAEIGDDDSVTNSNSEIRRKTLEYLKKEFDTATKIRANSLITAMLLDEMCNMVEEIGLFEPEECHDMLIKMTKEKRS